MATKMTWAVAQMDAYPEYEGHADVVFTVHWTLTGTDGTNTTGVYGTVGLTLEQGASFTPYASLTEAQVVNWVKAGLGDEQVAAYEANVAKQIADLANPPVVTPPLPWGAK